MDLFDLATILGLLGIILCMLVQVYSMVINKNTKINGYGFIFGGLSGFLLSYSILELNNISSYSAFFIFTNSIVISTIGILALVHK
jgi:hypothetical protein